jgi:hypothetical protein
VGIIVYLLVALVGAVTLTASLSNDSFSAGHFVCGASHAQQ